NTGKRADVDDTPTIVREMLERLLGCEKYTENVCIKHPVELLLGDFFQRYELIDAGVIDHDVELAESFLCFGKQSVDFCLFRDVALDRDRLSTALANFVDKAICTLFVGPIINDHGRPLVCELFCDACANSFGCPRYHRNFST